MHHTDGAELVRDRICCVSVRYDVGVFSFPESATLRVTPFPPPPTPQTDRTADGGGGWRVVYSTRTASREHVLFFLVYTYCLRLCTAALRTQLFIRNDPSSQLFTQLSGIPFTDFKQSGSWAL